ncbi:MAG TPA: response regulator transcription factor, partial [Steroidobacteraceae bacterium]|nr:response regulator transcription factor [Steroidobacteraceae bacterium]
HSEFTPELVCRLSGELRATRIIIFTVLADEDQVVGALRAGAAGYMLKAASGAELIESVRRVHKGESYVFPPLAARLMGLAVKSRPKPDLFSGLTVREEQILDHLSRGLSNKEIGRELDLSEKTIKHYLSGLLQKLHLRNRVEAALAAQSRPGKSLRALSFRHVSQQPLSP